MNEAIFYLGLMMVVFCSVIITAALCVAMFNPAPQVAGGKPEGYIKRVWVTFKEL